VNAVSRLILKFWKKGGREFAMHIGVAGTQEVVFYCTRFYFPIDSVFFCFSCGLLIFDSFKPWDAPTFAAGTSSSTGGRVDACVLGSQGSVRAAALSSTGEGHGASWGTSDGHEGKAEVKEAKDTEQV
jgi:hypothetical protein